MAQAVFNRYEKKYLMPEPVYQELRFRLAPYMQTDQYGLHTICNIYYDTPGYDLIRRSIEKPVYKEKLRLRSYGIPTLDSPVFLEIKKKYRKVVNKRRIQLTLQEAYDYVERGIQPAQGGDYVERGIQPAQSCKYAEHGIRSAQDRQILQEINFFLYRYPLMRGIYLAYDRTALFGMEDPEFRVTFDQRIRSRRSFMGLENGDYGELLLPEGYYLMESKVLGATPLWFTEILSELEIYPVSFSKYGNVYKKEHGVFDLEQMMIHRNENWEENRRRQVC